MRKETSKTKIPEKVKKAVRARDAGRDDECAEDLAHKSILGGISK